MIQYFVTGACCLCTGSVIFFLFASFLWLLVTTFFLVGSLSDHFVCKTLENTTNSELGAVADKYLNKILNENIDNINLNLSISNVLDQCRDDKTIYEIFQLDTAFNLTSDIENWQDKFEINKTIAEIKAQVDTALNEITENINIEDYEDRIKDLSSTLEQMTTFINSSIVNLSISSVLDVTKLDEIKEQINLIPDQNIKDTFYKILYDFQAFNATFEEERQKFSDYLTNALVFDVSYYYHNRVQQ